MNNLYQFKSVGVHFDSGFSLDDINIEIKESTVTAVVGPNGSGKTSLLNIVSFLNPPDKGEIEYAGNRVLHSRFANFRQKVGYVQQSPYLLRGTVFDNIELGLRLKKINKESRINKVNEVMEILAISPLADRIARTLSGGEAQKVAIAQMLVLDPEVLVLDEPFTHLDKDAINDLECLIIRLKEDLNKTVILTTHDKFQAQWLADEVYSVIKGKVFKSHLANLFSGRFNKDSNLFDTGSQVIIVPEGTKQADHVAIDPKLIVLSNECLESIMQNSFSGKITSMIQENGQVRVIVDAGENFEAIVSHKSLTDLDMSIGADVWISFKSSSILVF